MFRNSWTVPLRHKLPGGAERGCRRGRGYVFESHPAPFCSPTLETTTLNSSQNKMGASLDTPARCPLCNELTRDPVILKCNHRFCQRCLGDLWSISPNGPYHCPEWRCKTVYQTLPFDRPLSSTSSRWAPPRSDAGNGTRDLLMLKR